MLNKGKEAYNQQCTILLKFNHSCLCLISLGPSFIDRDYKTSSSNILALYTKQRPDNDHNKFKLVDDLIYFEDLLYILEGLTCLHVFEVRHDFLVIRHFRFNKT